MTPIKLSLSEIKIISCWKEILFFFHTNHIVCLIYKSYGTYFVLSYHLEFNEMLLRFRKGTSIIRLGRRGAVVKGVDHI